jgi:hypothetical protein
LDVFIVQWAAQNMHSNQGKCYFGLGIVCFRYQLKTRPFFHFTSRNLQKCFK